MDVASRVGARAAGVLVLACGLLIAGLAVACPRQDLSPSPSPTIAPTATREVPATTLPPSPTATGEAPDATVLPAPSPTVEAAAATPSPSISPPPLTATPIEEGAEERPILHMGVEKSGTVAVIVTEATYADGRGIGPVVRSVGAAWSPKGTEVAFVEPSGHSLRVANLEGEERTVINSSSIWRPYYAWPAWSPDGTEIALVEVGWCEPGNRIVDIVVVEAATGKVTSRHGPHDFWRAFGTENGPTAFSMPEAFRWSPDGGKLLVSWDNASVLHLDTGKVERVSDTRVIAEWAPGSDAVYYFETAKPGSPRGGRTLTAFSIKALGRDAVTTLADVDMLADLGLAQAPSQVPGLLALSPEGSTLAVTTAPSQEGASTLIAFDLAEGRVPDPDMPSRSFEASGRIVAIDWSPDGGSLTALVVDEAGSTTLQVLYLKAGSWRTIAEPDVDVDAVDDIPMVLSWGR